MDSYQSSDPNELYPAVRLPPEPATNDMWGRLPENVFISYSYEDEAGKDALLDCLRQWSQASNANAFPFSEPDPHAAVSNGIVPRILSCGALIYVATAHSANSLWVNFERDYARRAGRQVFSFDPGTQTLAADAQQAIPLRVTLVMGDGDEQRAKELLEWMKQERLFEFEAQPIHLRMKEIPGFVAGLLHRERVVVWLLNRQLVGVADYSFEVPISYLEHEYARRYDAPYTHDDADFEHYSTWLAQHSMFVRLNPDWELSQARNDPEEEPIARELSHTNAEFKGPWAVDLVSQVGNGIDWNRADDLIVRLTYMLGMSKPFFLSNDGEAA